MRTDWDTTWLLVAQAMAGRSQCVNRQVGCVIVDPNNRPVSVGYNGAPAGYPVSGSCNNYCARGASQVRGASYSNCVSVHAEANALIFADRRTYAGGTIYITNPCCFDCAKLVANSGVSRVVWLESDADEHADKQTPTDFLRDCGLEVSISKRRK